MARDQKPTLKQRKAFQNMTTGTMTKKEALLDAGYSESTANAPQVVEQTDGFQYLLNKHAPDDKIMEKLEEYLDLEEVVLKNMEGGGFEAVPTGQPHKQRLAVIETLLKLKDRYPAQKKAIDHTTGGKAMDTVINIIKPEE